MAITDHDTLSGWDEAVQAASGTDLEIVPGVELSTVWGDRSLHILGFYPDRDRLLPSLQERLEGRKRRAVKMIEKLAAIGYPVTLAEQGEGIAPGRPHIAHAMVQAGYVASSKEAFDRFLTEGKPAYVQYEKFSALEGIALLRQSGAVPVWAHPYLWRGGDVKRALPLFVEAGLMGLEVYHPSHLPNQVQSLEKLCQQYGLLLTGGSDYHGPAAEPDSTHSPSLNTFHLPLTLLTPVKQAAGKAKPLKI